MKALLALPLLFAMASICMADDLWPQKKFSYAVAFCYDYSKDKDAPGIIQKNSKHHPGIISACTVRLNLEQTKKLRQLLSVEVAKPQGSADCFWPHHGFVFYDEKWQAQAHFSLCVGCNSFQSVPDAESLFLDFESLTKFIKELGLPVFPTKGPRKPNAYTKLFESTERSEQGEEPDAENAPE